MLPVRLRPEAVAELAHAWAWYEDHQRGLGDDFGACIDEAISSISRGPLLHAAVDADVRRCLGRRFPYGVFDLIAPDHIEVLAVFHAARDPGDWRERVG
jgi:toxin ParE1/3/4